MVINLKSIFSIQYFEIKYNLTCCKWNGLLEFCSSLWKNKRGCWLHWIQYNRDYLQPLQKRRAHGPQVS